MQHTPAANSNTSNQPAVPSRYLLQKNSRKQIPKTKPPMPMPGDCTSAYSAAQPINQQQQGHGGRCQGVDQEIGPARFSHDQLIFNAIDLLEGGKVLHRVPRQAQLLRPVALEAERPPGRRHFFAANPRILVRLAFQFRLAEVLHHPVTLVRVAEHASIGIHQGRDQRPTARFFRARRSRSMTRVSMTCSGEISPAPAPPTMASGVDDQLIAGQATRAASARASAGT